MISGMSNVFISMSDMAESTSSSAICPQAVHLYVSTGVRLVSRSVVRMSIATYVYLSRGFRVICIWGLFTWPHPRELDY